MRPSHVNLYGLTNGIRYLHNISAITEIAYLVQSAVAARLDNNELYVFVLTKFECCVNHFLLSLEVTRVNVFYFII